MRRRYQGKERKAILHPDILINLGTCYAESETTRHHEMIPVASYHSYLDSQPSLSAGRLTQPVDPIRAGCPLPDFDYHSISIYPATSEYLSPGQIASIKPGPNVSEYSYGVEYPKSDPSHRQAPTNPNLDGGGYSDLKEERVVYCGADPRDARTESRDPRMDPRNTKMDPIDPGLDIRPISQTISLPSMSSPGDASKLGAVSHPVSFDYFSSMPPIHSGMGEPLTTGFMPHGYDPRGSQTRDSYRSKPIRDVPNSGGEEGNLVEGAGGSVPTLHSHEDLLQPSITRSGAKHNEEYESLGKPLSSVDILVS